VAPGREMPAGQVAAGERQDQDAPEGRVPEPVGCDAREASHRAAHVPARREAEPVGGPRYRDVRVGKDVRDGQGATPAQVREWGFEIPAPEARLERAPRQVERLR